MTTDIGELQRWNDPDDLFRALTRIRRDQRDELQDAVLALVDHPDADIRTEAIRKLYVWWRDKRSRGNVVAALADDPHYGVRRVAAFGVAATTDERTRHDDMSLLLRTFLNEAEDIAVRGAAYEGLLLMNGKHDFPPIKREIDVNRDIDWNWVTRLRAQLRL